ncbi:flagellar hook-length control protein FliK [Paraglaciecola sp. 2405UD69-4]|uniref:flagellar hook-length control protein FliK n=1 Tax=Paraglaciecola sp. 2405UD69-4 TaxID=3391836 RepID=UPI0039C91958
MPDIPLSSQATASQAITQLSQLSSTSDIAKQGIEVLVKHLGGNEVSLSKDASLLSKTVTLTSENIKEALSNGQKYQVRVASESPLSLQFFTTPSSSTPTSSELTKNSFLLSEQQITNLLKLPAKQLIAGLKLNQADKVLNALQLQGTVAPTKIKESIETTAKLNQTPTSNLQPKLQNQLPLKLNNQAEISIPLKQASQFIPNDKVALTIIPKGNNWQISISKLDNTPVPPQVQLTSKPIDKPIDKPILNQTSNASQQHTSRPEAKTQQTLVPAKQAPNIIKQAIQQHSSSDINKAIEINLPIKQTLQQLVSSNIPESVNLAQKLQTLPIQKLSLQVSASGDAMLTVQNQKPLMTIPVTRELAQNIAPLKVPGLAAITKLVTQPLSSGAALPANPPEVETKAVAPTTDNKATAPKELAVNTSKPETTIETKNTLKEASAALLKEVIEKPMANSIVSSQLFNNKPKQTTLLQSLIRIVQPKAEAPTNSLQVLDNALSDKEFFKGPQEASTKQMVEQVLTQVKQGLPQAKEADSQNIRQLLTAPILNLSNTQLANPATNQGLFSGLITMLQISLSSRLVKGQNQRSEQIVEILNKVLSTSGKSTTSKGLQEFSQLEQKHQLIRGISRLMSAHQANKLASAEQQVQGQDTFYYNLPSMMAGSMKDVELLIKRESDQQNNEDKEQAEHKTWQLTMKLSVGEMGELLTKAKLRPDNIDINFYASNDQVKIQVMNYLPLLKRKLDTLGITVNKTACQLGKIPDTLAQRPYHVFQTQA